MSPRIKFKILVFSLVTLVPPPSLGYSFSLKPHRDLDSDLLWEDFCSSHRKLYPNAQELARRKALFFDRCHKILGQQSEFQAGRASWEAKVYWFSDFTPQEFLRTRCGTRPKTDDSEVFYSMFYSARNKRALPPSSWDIRTQGPGLLNPIKDQGVCGACWAFASAAAFENAFSVKMGALFSFSEQVQIDCNANALGCEGGWFTDAFLWAKANGWPTTLAYPYAGLQSTCKTNVTGLIKNLGYIHLAPNELAIKSYISTKGACSACVDATNWDLYASGIFDGAPATPQCNHGVVIVGYGVGFWILRNSWGSWWGENGHVRVTNTTAGGLLLNTVYCPTF